MLKILHIGNIANNAYNNAKYLNRSGKHHHAALNFDNPHIMACPEWEEIDTFKEIKEFSPDWRGYNYRIPDWYSYIETVQLDQHGRTRALSTLGKITLWRRQLAYWLKDRGLKKDSDGFNLPVLTIERLKVIATLPVYLILHTIHWTRSRLENTLANTSDDLTGYALISKKLASRLDHYDIIQAYGADVIIPFLLNKPYIAYEHGTLRDLPFDGTPRANLLSKAYKNAATTIITNPDVIASAERLGLDNYVYIPHAVDCDRFKPTDSSILRDKFNLADEFIILAPARQNWDIKGNNKYIEAFSELLKIYPKSKLFICDWGQHRDLTKALVAELNLNQKVHYYLPCPKLTSIHYYQLADIVVDQFEAGAFGGITPEAMACEKPTIVYYQPSVHEWCFDSHPPVINAASASEIKNAFIKLAGNSEQRVSLGKKGREWVLKEYSIEQLVRRHNIVHDTTLAKQNREL